MSPRKRVVCGLVLAAMSPATAIVSGTAHAEQERVVSGIVIAVAPASRTIVVEAKVGKSNLVVGAEVPEGTPIEGANALTNISAGDHVTLRYVRTGSGLTARSISRLPSK